MVSSRGVEEDEVEEEKKELDRWILKRGSHKVWVI